MNSYAIKDLHETVGDIDIFYLKQFSPPNRLL
jgi:hypothetical protein